MTESDAQSRQSFMVENDSNVDADVYVRPSGNGRWRFEETIRARDSHTFNNAYRGDDYGFSNPNSSQVDIIKQERVSSSQTSLLLTDRDVRGNGGGVAAALGRDIKVTNVSSVSVDVYADDGSGSGWQFVDTLRPHRQGNPVPEYGAFDGHSWCIDDPSQGGVQPIKTKAIQVWDRFPTLRVDDADLAGKEVTAVNNCAIGMDVYTSSDGRNWNQLGRLDARGGNRDTNQFNVVVGDSLGFDDPSRSGLDIINGTAISRWTNRISVSDSDLARNNGRLFTATNDCSIRMDVYSSSDGRNWTRESGLDARGGTRNRDQFSGTIGNRWGFDDPSTRGINIVKNTPIAIWTNRLTVSDSDIPGQQGGQQGVRITFENEESEAVNLYRKPGWIGRSLIGTVPRKQGGRNGRLTLNLNPGDWIVGYDSSEKLFEVRSLPGIDTTYEIDD